MTDEDYKELKEDIGFHTITKSIIYFIDAEVADTLSEEQILDLYLTYNYNTATELLYIKRYRRNMMPTSMKNYFDKFYKKYKLLLT